jgi:hypothetical protein
MLLLPLSATYTLTRVDGDGRNSDNISQDYPAGPPRG